MHLQDDANRGEGPDSRHLGLDITITSPPDARLRDRKRQRLVPSKEQGVVLLRGRQSD